MGSSKKSSDKDKERDREVRKKRRDRSRERTKRRSKSRDRYERSRSRERLREREKRRDRSKSRDRNRDRSKSRERGRIRSRSRDRGRERSRSRERGRERSRSRERGRERSRSRDRGRERSRSRGRGRDKEQEENNAKKGGAEQPVATPTKEAEPVEFKPSSSNDISMSIDDTNKLRVSLGLKPLQVEGEESNSTETAVKKEPVHAPPKNIGEIKAAEKLKEKISTSREKRQISQALSSVKTLGQEDGVEDTSSWIARMREKDIEKKKAEEKAKMLAEMDEEFGIADLISEVVQEDKNKAYGSKALSGLTVEHDVGTFKEGRDVTLVIKDSGILEDSADVLLNVNMVEAELAAKNVELKKGKPGYNPYAEENVDDLGNVKKQELLSKYDEEILGEKKKAFVLGAGGEVNTEEDRERAIIKQRLLDKKITLEMAPAQVATEYFTSEEMVQFKKVKKRKLRKKGRVKADDLVPLGNEDTSKDHGSRGQGSKSRGAPQDDVESMEVETALPADGGDLRDEADNNVANALIRTRRLLKNSKTGGESTGVAKVMGMLQSRGPEAEMEAVKGVGFGEDEGGSIILDTTSEFCKQVGEEERTAGTGSGGDHDDSSRGNDHHHHHHDITEEDMDADEEGGWMEVRENVEKKKEPQVADLYQEAEPLVAVGVAATLQLAAKKGFVTDSSSKPPKRPDNVIVQTSAGKRDIEYERQKEKERDRELSRFGRESAFVEKKGYVPNVKIEHFDETGRSLNTKEAFRYMSHKFHGRGSGRKKIEKRLKRFQQEKLLMSSSSVDTPLNTLAVLQSKQKAAQSPYILVSGGAQSLLAPDIAKRK